MTECDHEYWYDGATSGRGPTCGKCGHEYHEPLPADPNCDHGVSFDKEVADRDKLDTYEIRKRWPRGYGPCPKGCGFVGIAYASYAHYIYGDW